MEGILTYFYALLAMHLGLGCNLARGCKVRVRGAPLVRVQSANSCGRTPHGGKQGKGRRERQGGQGLARRTIRTTRERCDAWDVRIQCCTTARLFVCDPHGSGTQHDFRTQGSNG